MIKSLVLAIAMTGFVFGYQADNTDRNKRDRSGGTMTADKQGNSKEDVRMAANIRRAVTKDKSLSTNAHNIKIVVNGGQVVLRGPVDSEMEKERVLAIVKQSAGEAGVADHLEVVKGEK